MEKAIGQIEPCMMHGLSTVRIFQIETPTSGDSLLPSELRTALSRSDLIQEIRIVPKR